MRTRHVVYMALVVVAAAAALAGCSLLGFVSISDRVGDFQASLNSTDRSSAYQNFHPTACSDYNSLKSSSFVIDPTFPTANISYSLSIVDQSNSSAVVVSITGSNAYAGPSYLRMNMQTTGLGDNRIVSMDTATSSSGPWTNIIQ
jgi:hypothetical protein